MKISREVKAAILVISGIVGFIYLFNYLKGEQLFSSDDVYYTEFDYKALDKSSLVTIKGNPVGKVSDIDYDFDTKKTKVSFTVNPKLKFSKNSIIRLYETGIMGGSALAIVEAHDDEIAKSGDFIASEVQTGLISNLSKNFSGLSTNLDRTLRSADTLLINLNTMVADDSELGIKGTIAELNATLKSFKNMSYSIQNMIKENDEKIAGILDNFNKASTDLTTLTDDLKDIEISKTISNLDKTLTSVNAMMADIESGEGSIGKLLKDDGLYNNLEGASLQLQQLLEDMKLNPKRYVHFSLFGKKPKQYDADGNEIPKKKKD